MLVVDLLVLGMIFSENRFPDDALDAIGVPMKVNVEIDCTPMEARQFFGLPDVQPMQTAVMERLQQQMLTNIQSVSTEALMQIWFPFDPKLAERFQDMFVTMAGLGARPV